MYQTPAFITVTQNLFQSPIPINYWANGVVVQWLVFMWG